MHCAATLSDSLHLGRHETIEGTLRTLVTYGYHLIFIISSAQLLPRGTLSENYLS